MSHNTVLWGAGEQHLALDGAIVKSDRLVELDTDPGDWPVVGLERA